jgi:hypothetical protein
MQFSTVAAAVVAATMILAAPAFAQTTPDTTKQPAQSMYHNAPAKQPAQSMYHNAPSKQPAQAFYHNAPAKPATKTAETATKQQ